MSKKNNRLVIGIGHKARQGKDTAASCLVEKYNCKVIHFADALYEECKTGQMLYRESDNTIFVKPVNEDYIEFQNPPENIVNWFKIKGEPRESLEFGADLFFGGMTEKDGALLQFWGTEFRRKKFNWDYWVDKVKNLIEAEPDVDFLLPDTRFKNEAQMVKDLNGVVWKVNRPNFVASDRDPNHQSEIDLDGWEFEINLENDGTIPELYDKAEAEYLKLKGEL